MRILTYLSIVLQCAVVVGARRTPLAQDEFILTIKEGVPQVVIDAMVAAIPNCRQTHVKRKMFLRASFTQAAVDAFLAAFSGSVELEQNSVVKGESIEAQPDAWWGQKRIVQDHPHLPRNYHYDPAWGASPDVVVYVVDTGVMCSHEELSGRCTQGYNFVSEETADDFNGHGTHVASIIAGTRFGVAKQTQVISVKVLDRESLGSVGDVVDALGWIVTNAAATGSVINLSLGTTYSVALNEAVTEAIAAGLHVVTSAGNYANDACLYSPASVGAAITVAATGLSYAEGSAPFDFKHDYSNHGPCVTVHAPGVYIMGAGIDGTSATAVRNGTSAAAPHVAAIVVAKLMEDATLSPAAVKAWLVGAAKVADIVGNVAGTTELMAHMPVVLLSAPEYPEVPESMENCFGYLEEEFGALQGTLTHPSGGGKYATNDMRCWAIRCEGTLTLTYTDFSFETGFDGLFTNNVRATGYTPPVYAPFNGDVLLRLESDPINAEYGFSVGWSCAAAGPVGITVRFTTGPLSGAASQGQFPVTLWFEDDSVSGTVTASNTPQGAESVTFVTHRAVGELVSVVVSAGQETDGWFISSCEVLIDGEWVQWYIPSEGFAASTWIDGDDSEQQAATFTPLQAFELTVRIGTASGMRWYDSAAMFSMEAVYATGETEMLGVFVPPGIGAHTSVTYSSRYPASAVNAVRVAGSTSDGWYLADMRLQEDSGFTSLIDPTYGPSAWMKKKDGAQQYVATRVLQHTFSLTCDVGERSEGVFDVHVTSEGGETAFAGHLFYPGKGGAQVTLSTDFLPFHQTEVQGATVSTQGVLLGGHDDVVLRDCVIEDRVLTVVGSGDTEFTVSLGAPVALGSTHGMTITFLTSDYVYADSAGSFEVWLGYAGEETVLAGVVVAPKKGITTLAVTGVSKGAEDVEWVEVRNGGPDGWYILRVKLDGAGLVTSGGNADSWVDSDHTYTEIVKWYKWSLGLGYTEVLFFTGNKQYEDSNNDFIITLRFSDGDSLTTTRKPNVLGGSKRILVSDKPNNLLVDIVVQSTGNDGWYISSVWLKASEAQHMQWVTDRGEESTWCDGDQEDSVKEVTFVAA